MVNFRENIIKDGTVKIEIFGMRPPIGIIIFLSIFFLAGLSIPIIVIAIIAEVKFSIVIVVIIFWGVAFFLLRLILWNLFGRQVFLFKDEKLAHYFDYKFFRDHSLEGMSSEFYFSTDCRRNDDGRILLHYNEKIITSPFLIDGLELTALLEKPQSAKTAAEKV